LGDDDDGVDKDGDDDDSDGTLTDVKSNRFYRFEVAKTKDQEEDVVVREGFTVR